MSAPLLRPNDLAKIHLKSQALVNLFFGIPMVTLVLPFWGLPLIATVKVTVTYLTIYVIYFIPLWYVMPRRWLRPIQPTLEHLAVNQSVDDLTLKHAIEFLLDYPLLSALKEFGLIITGFMVGAALVPLGVVPELLPITWLAVIYVLVVGLVVSVIESFLNFTFLENRLSQTISAILTLRPTLASENFESRRVSLLHKMLFVILGTVMAAQLILFILMVGKLALSFPQAVGPTIAYLGAFMLLTAGYVLVAATIFTRNISSPLTQLIAWSSGVMHGQRGSLPIATNDELSDVASYSNHMVENLNNLTSWLQKERDQLAVEKDKLAVVLSRVDDGVVASNVEGIIVLFNRAMEELTGWSEDEVLGKPLSILELYRENGEVYSFANFSQQTEHKQRMRHADLKILTKHQHDRYVALSATPLIGNQHLGLGWIFTFHDTTEQKELELMKLDFVSMAAHELRTPLTAIRGYLSLLADEAAAKLSSEEQTFLNRSLAGSNQLAALVENLLNVSRIERNDLVLELAAISLPKLIAQTVDVVREVASQKQISVIYQPTDLPLVQADPFRIGEVLTNLVANAINYSPQKTAITISTELQSEMVIVHIADQGEGIPAQALPHLFKKFYRVAGRLSEGSKGTGLGLFISRGIIEAHHGKIWAESQEGKGSTFSFSLHLAPVNAVETVLGKALIRPATLKNQPTSTSQLLLKQ